MSRQLCPGVVRSAGEGCHGMEAPAHIDCGDTEENQYHPGALQDRQAFAENQGPPGERTDGLHHDQNGCGERWKPGKRISDHEPSEDLGEKGEYQQPTMSGPSEAEIDRPGGQTGQSGADCGTGSGVEQGSDG